jgi:hypothetical protein
MLHQVGVDTSVYQNTGQIRDHQVSMMDKPIGHLWVSIAFKLALLILDKKIHAMFVNTYELYYRLGVLSGNNMDPLWLCSDFYVYRWRSRISLPGRMIHTHWKFTPNPTIMMLSAPLWKGIGDLNRSLETSPGLAKMHPERKHKRQCEQLYLSIIDMGVYIQYCLCVAHCPVYMLYVHKLLITTNYILLEIKYTLI